MQTAKPSTYGGYFVAKASVGERLCGQHESIAIVLHAIKLSATFERWHNQQPFIRPLRLSSVGRAADC